MADGSGVRTWIDWRRLAAAVGVTLLVASGLLAFGLVPSGVEQSLARTVEDVGVDSLLGGVALVVGAYALYGAWTQRRAPAVPDPLFESDPETVDGAGRRLGSEFEVEVERRASITEGPLDDGGQQRARLRETAVDLLVQSTADDRSTAVDRVKRGEWTDDRIAAAFLGTDDAPGYPFEERVRGWIDPSGAYERRVNRAVDALHRQVTGSE